MEKKSIVEEALLSMKNLEEAVQENAKGILASTMKEEIKDLVKESLLEQGEEEDETEVDVDTDVSDDDMEDVEDSEEEMDTDSEEEMDITMDMDSDDMDMDSMEDDMEPIDLTNASDEEILKVFKAMGEEDGIIVKKDDGQIHLKDENDDLEYLIKLGESKEEKMNEDDEELFSDAVNKLFEKENTDMEETDMNYEGEWNESNDQETETDEVVYEISLDDEEDSVSGMGPEDAKFESNMYEMGDEEFESNMYEMGNEEFESDMGETSMTGEEYDFKESYKMETKEGKMSVKPKGVGMGKPKFSYKKTTGGFDEDMKHGNPTKGTGKPKFEYKEGDMKMKKAETKEAARTLGNGTRWGRKGLPKPKAAPRHLSVESVNQYEEQLNVLREKNEEYRKALNIFREKLNEVAVFNSNLAYATRLFTEHSTTKQEKINILRRFDGAETIKESKNLYRTIKEELGDKPSKVVTESISNKIDKDPVSGSAQNLIESKTYENPQFMRMKDLMSKLTK